MRDSKRHVAAIAALALAGGVAACGESTTGPGSAGDGAVSLSFSVKAAPSASAAVGGSGAVAFPSPNFDIVLDDGTNTLEITRVAMVLREIELERQFDECDDSSSDSSGSDSSDDSSSDSSSDDDSCEELSFGPELVELPVDGTTDRMITLQNVEPDIYDEIEFDIHKPDDDTQADREFLRANPAFDDVSIRVEGQYNGTPFVYLTDLNEEQEIELIDPIVVGPNAAPVNVTLSIDVSSWFKRADGSLIDPATANKGGPNENLVEDNIEDSIEGFEDEDFDGEDDDREDDSPDDGTDDDGTPDQGPGDN